MVVIMMYENSVIATRKKSIELEPPSMDVIVLHIGVPQKNLLSNQKVTISFRYATSCTNEFNCKQTLFADH